MRFRHLLIAAVALGAPASARAQDWAAPIARDTVLRLLAAQALERNQIGRAHV